MCTLHTVQSVNIFYVFELKQTIRKLIGKRELVTWNFITEWNTIEKSKRIEPGVSLLKWVVPWTSHIQMNPSTHYQYTYIFSIINLLCWLCNIKALMIVTNVVRTLLYTSIYHNHNENPYKADTQRYETFLWLHESWYTSTYICAQREEKKEKRFKKFLKYKNVLCCRCRRNIRWEKCFPFLRLFLFRPVNGTLLECRPAQIAWE